MTTFIRAASAAIAVLGCGLCASAPAQTYPAKPVRFLVGFAAGGGTEPTAMMDEKSLSGS